MSLYFKELRLTNFLPFRGEHEVLLGPGIFALTAERDGDPRRSNAQGKSAFGWALRFVLTGDHPKRTEEEWITDGEREGGVDAELSDGTFVSRWRTRGDATRLKVVSPVFRCCGGSDEDPPEHTQDCTGAELEKHGDEAQAWLDRHLGFSKDEQMATWWCEQGHADALVNGEPGELTATIVEWCGVEPVRRAAKIVSDDLAILLKQDAKQLAIDEDAFREIVQIEPKLPIHWDEWEKPRLANIERLRMLSSEQTAVYAKQREEEQIRDDAARWDELELERVQLEGVQTPPSNEICNTSKATLNEARDHRAAVQRDCVAKEKLARGEFDGVCPVGGIACPAKDQLNADAEQARLLVIRVKRDWKVASEAEHAAATVVSIHEALLRNHDHAQQRLVGVKRELERFAPSKAASRALAAAVEDEPTTFEIELDTAEQELREMRALQAKSAGAATRRATAMDVRKNLAPIINAHREALQVLGPTGAQRWLVEGLLGTIEAATNDDLAEAGVGLSVAFEWQRELPAPATTCVSCGQPFPASTKVKACEHCGAPRGRKIEQKLRVVVTPKSGGMDALAGIGCRLAATAWLKERRASGWSVAFLDEPLAAVDMHHRMLIGRHLVAMLGTRFGVEQAFVTAHDPALLGALPRHIVVLGSELGSTIEVLA